MNIGLSKIYSLIFIISVVFTLFLASHLEGVIGFNVVYPIFFLGLTVIYLEVVKTVKNKNHLLMMLVIVIVSGVSAVFSAAPSALMYSCAMLLGLCAVARCRRSFVVDSPRGQVLTVLLFGIVLSVILLFISDQSKRAALPWLSNPNYSALAAASILLSMYAFIYYSNQRKRAITPVYFGLFLMVPFFTGSRTFYLAFLLLAITHWMVSARFSEKGIRGFSVAVIFSSVSLPFFFQYLTSNFGYVEGREVTSLLDESVHLRFIGVFQGFSLITQDLTFLYRGLGSAEAIKSHELMNNVPHNWFMTNVLASGLSFAGVVCWFLVYFAIKIPVHVLPPFTAIIAIAFVQGRAPLFYSLILFFLALIVICAHRSKKAGP